MSWQNFLQLGIAVGIGGGLAYWSGDATLLKMLAAGVVAAVLHAIPMSALSNMGGGK